MNYPNNSRKLRQHQRPRSRKMLTMDGATMTPRTMDGAMTMTGKGRRDQLSRALLGGQERLTRCTIACPKISMKGNFLRNHQLVPTMICGLWTMTQTHLRRSPSFSATLLHSSLFIIRVGSWTASATGDSSETGMSLCASPKRSTMAWTTWPRRVGSRSLMARRRWTGGCQGASATRWEVRTPPLCLLFGPGT